MLRHCSMQELLEVRNGEGSVGARIHVDECQECRDELDRLHQRIALLKALPSLNAPRDRWPVVRERIVTARRRLWLMRVGWAAAAAVGLMMGANGLMHRTGAVEEPTQELRSLAEYSAQFDSVLTVIDAQRRVVNGLTAVAIADLEDRIQAVDARIVATRQASVSRARQEELLDLMRERLVLMDALVNTHRKRAVYVGF